MGRKSSGRRHVNLTSHNDVHICSTIVHHIHMIFCHLSSIKHNLGMRSCSNHYCYEATDG